MTIKKLKITTVKLKKSVRKIKVIQTFNKFHTIYTNIYIQN